MRLDSFSLAMQDVAEANLQALHALSLSVGWPHRQSDWDLLRSVGRGIVALDEIGRVFSSAMWFPHGEDCATVGMVITSPRVQTHGGGRWMMDHILRECGDRPVILNSTRAAYHLYVSLGFMPQATVYQCQGVVSQAPAAPGNGAGATELLSAPDLAAISDLDAEAFGADRSTLLERLLPGSTIHGIRRDGNLAGYAFRRPFGRGQVIGPLIARTEADAMALATSHLQDLSGQFVRIDTRQRDGALRSALMAAGLQLFDTATTLTRGKLLPPVGNGRPSVYGLVGHALS